MVWGQWAPNRNQTGQNELLKLAQGEFSNLSPAETALIKFAGDYRSAPGGFAAAGPAIPDDPTNDPAHADEWSAEREVRAELIRWLCVDPRARALIDPQGIRLLGARIIGSLNLSDLKVPFPLVLHKCAIGERMIFERAVFPLFDLGGSYTGEIDGNGIVVHSDLDLNFLHPSGEVGFSNSTVDGNLYAAGGRFMHSKVAPQVPLFSGQFGGSSTALDVHSSQIQGIAAFCCGFEADGAVVLAASTVGALDFHWWNIQQRKQSRNCSQCHPCQSCHFPGLISFRALGGSRQRACHIPKCSRVRIFCQGCDVFGGSW